MPPAIAYAYIGVEAYCCVPVERSRFFDQTRVSRHRKSATADTLHFIKSCVEYPISFQLNSGFATTRWALVTLTSSSLDFARILCTIYTLLYYKNVLDMMRPLLSYHLKLIFILFAHLLTGEFSFISFCLYLVV